MRNTEMRPYNIRRLHRAEAGAAERHRQVSSLSNNSSTPSRSTNFNGMSRKLSGGLQSMRSFLSGGSGKEINPGPPLHERQSPENQLDNGDLQPHVPMTSPHELLYILLCYSQGRYAVRLLQLDLIMVQAKSDKALFKILRDSYHSMRGIILSYISLRTLCSIKFVHFEMCRRELVDVRKPDDIPPPENKDYRYQAAQPELIPRVGERHMVHLFEHPDHAEDESLCLNRSPKKLKEKAQVQRWDKSWVGLQFVEGWDARNIWVFVIRVLWSWEFVDWGLMGGIWP